MAFGTHSNLGALCAGRVCNYLLLGRQLVFCCAAKTTTRCMDCCKATQRCTFSVFQPQVPRPSRTSEKLKFCRSWIFLVRSACVVSNMSSFCFGYYLYGGLVLLPYEIHIVLFRFSFAENKENGLHFSGCHFVSASGHINPPVKI